MNEILKVSIPWYRTRKFWAVVYSLMLTWSVFFYFWVFFESSHVLGRVLLDISFSVGSTFLFLLGNKLLGSTGGYIGVFLYIFIFGFLLKKTFNREDVRILFPVLFISNYLLGIVLTFLFLGSFV
jgi:hypothetical protein